MSGKVNSGKKTDTKPVKSKQTSASSGVNPVKGKGGKSGLKIVHHGLKCPALQTKGRYCKCDMCGETFGTSTSFIEHYSTTHPPLPCKDCSKVFSNPLSLQKHRYHHVGKKFPCDMCEWSFPFDSQLKDHHKSHFKTKPHICSYPNCGKEATHLYDMKKHERTHIKDNLKCNWCTYETKDSQNLAQHTRTHTEKKPYSCPKCHKKFMFYMQKKCHNC